MEDAIALTLGQDFEIARFSKAIDATSDPAALRGIAKQLLMAWLTQQAATRWMMRQRTAPTVRPADLALEPPPWDDPLA